jgi:ABC-type polysaccharide/polyol phosphate export permease
MDDCIKTFQRIQILLSEYNSVRAEVMCRYTAQFQSSGIAAVVLLAIITVISNHEFNRVTGGLLLADLVIWLMVLLWIDVDISQMSQRLRDLEAIINSLASGEPLLRWETERGIDGVVGTPIRNSVRYFKRRFTKSSSKE